MATYFRCGSRKPTIKLNSAYFFENFTKGYSLVCKITPVRFRTLFNKKLKINTLYVVNFIGFTAKLFGSNIKKSLSLWIKYVITK